MINKTKNINETSGQCKHSCTLLTFGRLHTQLSYEKVKEIQSFFNKENKNDLIVDFYIILGKYDILSVVSGNDIDYLKRRILEFSNKFEYYDIINIPSVENPTYSKTLELTEKTTPIISMLISLNSNLEKVSEGINSNGSSRSEIISEEKYLAQKFTYLKGKFREIKFTYYNTTASDDPFIFAEGHALDTLIRFIKELRMIFRSRGSISYCGFNIDYLSKERRYKFVGQSSNIKPTIRIDVKIKINQRLEQEIRKKIWEKIEQKDRLIILIKLPQKSESLTLMGWYDMIIPLSVGNFIELIEFLVIDLRMIEGVLATNTQLLFE